MRLRDEAEVHPEISVVIPALNEETTIFELVRNFAEIRKDLPIDVLVIDGHSTDKTVEMARKAGAKVIMQRSLGKGMAMIEAVERTVDAGVCLFIDGDGTYLPCEFERITKPVLGGEADMVVGSRINGQMEKGAILPVNRIGNMFCNLVVRIFFRKRVTDVLSGYRAIKTEVFRELGLKSRHFEIEAEMTARVLSKGLTIAEVPITYRRRRGKTTKLKPFKDGLFILRALIREALDK